MMGKSRMTELWSRMTKVMAMAFFILLVTMSFTAAQAQTWHQANQITLEWDAVDTLEDNSPVPMSDFIRYRVYTKNDPGGVIVESTTDAITDVNFSITFVIEGKYFVGVRSERWVGGEFTGASAISWSSDATVCGSGEAFGVIFYSQPTNPKALKFSSMNEVRKYMNKHPNALLFVLDEGVAMWYWRVEKNAIVFDNSRRTRVLAV